MLPTWLFEADVFGTTVEPLKAEIRRQGMRCVVTRQDILVRGLGDVLGSDRIDAGECVIACGCYPFIRFVLDHRRWIPGGWVNPEALACSTYYQHFAPFLLNSKHVITTAVEALRDPDAIFAAVGRDEQVFIRPDGCQKTFTGRVVSSDEFAFALGPARYDATTRIVIAQARPIAREWRLIIAEDEVVAASQYLVEGEINTQPGCPARVREFTRGMLAAVAWRPDEIFMIDVCESDGSLYLLELNGFSCSAVYPCDYRPLVAAASRLAIRRWERDTEGQRGPQCSVVS